MNLIIKYLNSYTNIKTKYLIKESITDELPLIYCGNPASLPDDIPPGTLCYHPDEQNMYMKNSYNSWSLIGLKLL